jgi:hypothetical protein
MKSSFKNEICTEAFKLNHCIMIVYYCRFDYFPGDKVSWPNFRKNLHECMSVSGVAGGDDLDEDDKGFDCKIAT